jgi:hypothetical protein
MTSRRRWIAALIVLLAANIASLVILTYGVIAWHEVTRSRECPLRPPRKVGGTVLDVSRTRLALEVVLQSGERSTIHIGFVCEPSVCAELDGVGRGDKVEATFGATRPSGYTTYVNELLHVRLGEPETQGVDADPSPCEDGAWVRVFSFRQEKDAAPWPRTGVFAGYYRFGFEISAFRPAGTKERWWLSGGASFEEKTRCHAGCYLVVRGELSALGPHGHRGAYMRELTVTEVLERRNLQPDEKMEF